MSKLGVREVNFRILLPYKNNFRKWILWSRIVSGSETIFVLLPKIGAKLGMAQFQVQTFDLAQNGIFPADGPGT